VITSRPSNRTITAGQSTTLTVGASGTTPLYYQWYLGTSGNTSTPVPGAGGASLTVTPAVGTNYWVRVSNACGAVNSATVTVSVTAVIPPPTGIRQQTPADFNGDRVSDVVVFRNGAWVNYSTGTGVWTGQPSGNCVPTPADYDGNGVTEYALFCGGAWNVYNANGTLRRGVWTGGVPGDLPAPADYDGNGADEVVVYRNGAWIAFDLNAGAHLWTVNTSGGAGAIPLPMDYDGDGRAEFSSYRAGTWTFFNDSGSVFRSLWTGNVAGELPVPGDYDGDGREEPVVFRGGAWTFYDVSSGARVRGVWTGAAPFKGAPLQPAPLDYDGDGALDFTIFAVGPWHFFEDDGRYRNGVWTGGVAGDQAISRRQHVSP
jgi:hypothetical protein